MPSVTFVRVDSLYFLIYNSGLIVGAALSIVNDVFNLSELSAATTSLPHLSRYGKSSNL